MMDESVAARDARSHAQISWYSTSTTSILPCTEVKPFLESFEVCVNNLNMNIYIESNILWAVLGPDQQKCERPVQGGGAAGHGGGQAGHQGQHHAPSPGWRVPQPRPVAQGDHGLDQPHHTALFHSSTILPAKCI